MRATKEIYHPHQDLSIHTDAMDSPAYDLEGLESEEAYPCKGCGDVRVNKLEVMANGDTNLIHRFLKRGKHSNLVG